MFPYLSDLLNYLFGTSFFAPLPMFGFMVAIAFLVANYIWVQEMKRKEKDGLHTFSSVKIMKGEKASLSDLVGNGIFGFVLGFKLIGFVFNFSTIVSPENKSALPDFILSLEGNFFGGIIFATHFKASARDPGRYSVPLTTCNHHVWC